MYVKATDATVEAFPYGVSELMRDNPNTSFPESISDEVLARFYVYPVVMQEVPQPFDEITQNVVEVNPTLVDGSWIQTWEVTAASDTEVADRLSALARNVRAIRVSLLAETDWAGLSDTVMSPEMAVYRQALRDITSQDGFPRNVVWPKL